MIVMFAYKVFRIFNNISIEPVRRKAEIIDYNTRVNFEIRWEVVICIELAL